MGLLVQTEGIIENAVILTEFRIMPHLRQSADRQPQL